jgi:hypothetical protein
MDLLSLYVVTENTVVYPDLPAVFEYGFNSRTLVFRKRYRVIMSVFNGVHHDKILFVS